jgi:hypothetical protein
MSGFLRKKGAVVVMMYDSWIYKVFRVTFNNISVIASQSILLVVEIKVPRK